MSKRITKYYVENDLHSFAIYSPCENYRYLLNRTQLNEKNSLLFILLNPSTATEKVNDPTISRCQKRAHLRGYKSFMICNLFAFRTKSPKAMKEYQEPIGSENDTIIKESLSLANEVICAWGNHGIHLNRSKEVLRLVESSKTPTFHLGLTKKNQPTHPLYVDYDRKLIKWEKK